MFDLVQPKRIAGAIEIYDNAITNCDEILSLIRSGDSQDWVRAQVGPGEISDVRTNDALFIDLVSLSNPVVIYKFAQKIHKYLDSYGKRYQVGFSGMEAACLNRYQEGQEYLLHSDAGPGHNRVISALLYMNDVESGGETKFPFFNETIFPKKGRLVIFPSDYAYSHEAKPPLHGEKYSLAIWTTRIL